MFLPVVMWFSGALQQNFLLSPSEAHGSEKFASLSGCETTDRRALFLEGKSLRSRRSSSRSVLQRREAPLSGLLDDLHWTTHERPCVNQKTDRLFQV